MGEGSSCPDHFRASAIVPFALGVFISNIPRIFRHRSPQLAQVRGSRHYRSIHGPTGGNISSPITGTLDCSVCLGALLLPRVTHCGHTFCTPCLVDLAGSDGKLRSCPECQNRIYGDTNSVPVNYAVKRVIDENIALEGLTAWMGYYRAEETARLREMEVCRGASRRFDSRERRIGFYGYFPRGIEKGLE